MEDFNNWSKLAETFDTAQSQAVRKCAFDWLANAQAQIRANNQIDTGFMWNSGYVRTWDESTYSQASAPLKKGQTKLEEVERPANNKEAYVAFGASYAWYQNYGTSRIPARPFLEPSKARTQASFDEALRRIDDKLREISH
jgi:phage gpG-like protein